MFAKEIVISGNLGLIRQNLLYLPAKFRDKVIFVSLTILIIVQNHAIN